MKLLVVSHTRVHAFAGRLHAYGPYAREIDVWAQLFSEVRIASPLVYTLPPEFCLPFASPNISVASQWAVGGRTLLAKLGAYLATPVLIWDLCRAMRSADAIHVRCPGNLGLLAVLLAPLFSDKLVAKYAGQWNGYPEEPWTVRLQRRLLSSRWWRGPVTVYGNWPRQPPNVIPFFTSVLTREQVARARAASVRKKKIGSPMHVGFVGRLSKAKRVDVLLRALGKLHDSSVPFQCSIVGDGPERRALGALAQTLGVSSRVRFTGGLPHELVLHVLETIDVQVLVSETEGWPKAIAEGMAFGAICIGSNRGFVPAMLGEGRGITVDVGDVDALAENLINIAREPARYQEMRRRAAHWAQSQSLDDLRIAIARLLEQAWSVQLDACGRSPATSVAQSGYRAEVGLSTPSR